jgi:hypothetical protein
MSPCALTSGRFGFAGDALLHGVAPAVDGVALLPAWCAAGLDGAEAPPHAAVVRRRAVAPTSDAVRLRFTMAPSWIR